MTTALLTQIHTCTLCQGLPLGPRPILQFSASSKILIVGQAPGRITHEKGVPFEDPSGDRLRAWLGVDRAAFYDPARFAIVPMGFCFPGTGQGGDLPPRPECARAWRARVLAQLTQVELTLILGRYAIDWHLPALSKASVTQAVAAGWRAWRDNPQDGPTLVLPHPSPRNNRWLKTNPWFGDEIIPALQLRVATLLSPTP